MVLEFVPLATVVLLLVVLALSSEFDRVDRRLTAFSYLLFGGIDVDEDSNRERRLRAAGIGTPYRVYVTKTYLYSSVASFSGAVVGVYAGALVADVLGVGQFSTPTTARLFAALPAWLTAADVKLFAVLVVSSVAVGIVAAGVVHTVRWWIPSIRADTRRRQIDASLPRMVAFVYALSRGGMAFPDVMRALARNRGVFGAGAEEMGVGVRNIDLFGEDLISATRDLSRRTPSEQFQSFTENLVSVLQSGRNLSEFLRDEYHRYREAAEEQQREVLELLATTAEVYVTVVVAGMLFLLTILLVIGLTSGDTLVLVRLITYVILPATNVLFVAYLSEITQPLRASRRGQEIDRDDDDTIAVVGEGAVVSDDDQRFGAGTTAATRSDGGTADPGGLSTAAARANRDRLRAHKRFQRIVESVRRPVDSLIDTPELVFVVTVPLALGFVLVQAPAAVDGTAVDLRLLDDVLVQAVLFVMATFAVVYELSQRRLERLERAVPDLLERLASLNEAGVSVVSSFERVRRSDVGELDEEVERIWRDIQWGATVEQALDRFERRVQTAGVTRVVTLITNAMRASNEIGPVLRIAAEQARADRRLKRERRQEMFTYLVVIYVAFLVFLIVIGAIDRVLIPNLPQQDPSTGVVTGIPAFLQVGDVDVDAYRLTFFHAGLVQATLSGLVGGQMGGGSLKDGVKHATVMLTITYLVFLLVPPPGVV